MLSVAELQEFYCSKFGDNWPITALEGEESDRTSDEPVGLRILK
jgi:hypothetical protein